ncbi:MAG: phosphomannomutase/phosphoglucomutase [Alphaproteobacteria bacterium]|nr:phosphomannomutase/phosphoglucomutase [Alphaproteobacteria bacterium]
MPHAFDSTILREYDIRGIVGKTLFAADARAIGAAFAAMLPAGHRKVATGYDGRLTSPELEAALVEGLTGAGVGVVRVGRGPTPMLYYAAATLDVDGGIMVTGSHNPPDYNGFKLVAGGRPFYGTAIRQLGERALAAVETASTPPGTIENRHVMDDYVRRLARDYDGVRPLHVAWDVGNGATGEVVQQLTRMLPGCHVLLNETIDGRFPAHHPDPTVPENLVQLQQAVAREGCDLGIAFDGDGDRIGVVDAQGRIFWGDQLMMVLAQDVLAQHPGAPILADIKASQVLFDEIARMGGQPVMMATGHSLMKERIAEIGAPLAGEMSGHIFFADRYYGFDDAVYVAVRLLGILGRSDRSLAAIRDGLPTVVNTPELRFPCDDTRKFAVVAEVRARLRQAGAEMTDIDGVRVRTADGWWLLRASNTQDVLVARAEAMDEAGLGRLKQQLAEALAASGVALPS